MVLAVCTIQDIAYAKKGSYKHLQKWIDEIECKNTVQEKTIYEKLITSQFHGLGMDDICFISLGGLFFILILKFYMLNKKMYIRVRSIYYLLKEAIESDKKNE